MLHGNTSHSQNYCFVQRAELHTYFSNGHCKLWVLQLLQLHESTNSAAFRP